MSGRPATNRVIRGRAAISVNDPEHPLPNGWIRALLSDVAELGTGHTPSRNHPEYWDGGVPWIGITDARTHHGGEIHTTSQTITALGLDNSSARLLPQGTICLSRTASVGYVVKMGRDMATSQDFVAWTCSDALDPDYLMAALLAEGEDIRKFGEGSTHTTIYFPAVKAFNVDVPPPAEQRRIVAKLDALTARIARARVELDRVPALAAKIRAAASVRLWDASGDTTLEDFLEAPIRNGLSVKGSDQLPGIRALRLSALRGAHVNLEDVRFLPITSDRAEPFRLIAGDVLVSRGNGTLSLVGKASVVETTPVETTIFPDTAFRLRVDRKKVSERWLSLVWNSAEVRSQVEGMARTTAGIWKISQRDLQAVRLPRVGFAEQVRIADEVQAAFGRADRLEAEASRARALLDRLESAILAKAFRGELVPQHPNDEPASVLLERIRAARAAAPKAKRGRKAAA
ncbi:type-1 restriction enzyme EcoKI specificity protein [Mesorhizobium sp. L-8-10]|uniref:restriction endonuclease subunit S n=1 Tax=Mesorhizobium sp. L-8-10 TaxID=2744523 RepID=UPI001925194A|nr:restriction endonuclease subunit S [Mesorhizobium sp. L-8-10]BCH33272.1 type-1 restriction enzyme EcoKI specificity protein [Mesorhizobium sp. L-8-10]